MTSTAPTAPPQRPVFVVGTGRCGSTLFSEMIRLHPDILSVSEWFTVLGERLAAEDAPADSREFWKLLTVPTPDGAELLSRYPNIPELRVGPGVAAEAGARGLAPILTIPLPHLAHDPEDALRDLHRHVMSASEQTLSGWQSSALSFLARRQGKTMWVERSGGSLAYVDSLRRSWRDARYVHLYRDGVACALSMYEHPYFRVRVARAVARSVLPIEACLEMNVPIEQFGAYWSAVVLRGVDVLRTLPDRDVIHIRYADLVDDPAPVLRRVQAFLRGSAEADDWVSRAAALVHRTRRRPRTGAPAVTRGLERACAVGMRELSKL